MTDKNAPRDAADAVKGLVQAVPVYEDLAQPAIREVGTTLARSVRVVLAPLRGLVWGWEQIEDYVYDALTSRLKDVPPDQIVTPQPAVAGPALEALKYAGPDPELREMYANLLARAMDLRTAQDAHPAFVEILRQLTPDEGRVLRLFAEKELFPVVSVTLTHADTSYDWVLRHFSTLGEEAGCAFPGLMRTYLDNLRRLGLVEVHEDKRDATPGAYDGIKSHPMVLEAMKQAQAGAGFTARIIEEVLVVTSLGRQFCDAVVSPEAGFRQPASTSTPAPP